MFTIATSALLYGVPLALIWFFARHDFAGRFALSDTIVPNLPSPPDRRHRLETHDIVDLNQFKKRLKAEKQTQDPGFFIGEKIAGACEDRPNLAAWWKADESSEAWHQVREDLVEVLNKEVIGDDRKNVRSEFMKRVRDKETRSGQKPAEFDQGALYRNVISRHPSANRIALLMTVAETRDFKAPLPELNRLLFEAYYGPVVHQHDRILRPNVTGRDQAWRLFWLVVTFGVALVGCICVNLNATSMHNFYLDLLADTFIRGGEGAKPLFLCELDTTTGGGPYHLLSATVNHRPSEPAPSKADPENLGQTRTEGFLLSRLFCGANSLGYQSTASYCGGRLRLADAMTISGAAVSPFQVTSWFIIALMVLANARTGQWLPRPRRENGPENHLDGGLVALFTGTFGPTFLGWRWTRSVARWPETPARRRSGTRGRCISSPTAGTTRTLGSGRCWSAAAG